MLKGSLATQRARSIAESVQIKHPGPAPKPTVNLDVDFYWKSEFASEIHDLAKEKEDGKYPTRLRSSDVGQILSKNFQTARERLASSFSDPVAPGSIGHTSDIGQVHSEVKKFYQSITRGSKRGTKGKEKLSTRLPRDNADLKRRLLQKQGNANVMDLVRIGRVNYYQFQDDPTQDPSRYWTSGGLTEIKHREAFLRQWRTMVVMAQRTANMWIGNTAELSNALGCRASYADPLKNELINHIKDKKVDTRSMVSHLPLIFGAKADLFGYDAHMPDLEKARAAMCSALRIAQAIRNQVTHFGNRQTFTKKLYNTICKPKFDNNYVDKIIQNPLLELMQGDDQERKTRLIEDLTSFGVPGFANEQQAEYLIGCAGINASASIDLPRFNRVLERLSGVKAFLKSEWRSNDPREQLPDPARFSGLQDQWASCKFHSAKLIYEKRFRKWLDDLSSGEGRQKLADAFAKTRAQGDLLARKARHNSKYYPLITAQSEKLPVFTEEHTIGLYFHDLRGFVTAEMKSNTRYTSNPEAAKKESAWVEAFKCDFLAVLFGEFMDREESRWILKLHSGSKPLEAQTKLREPSPTEDRIEPWKANFYYFSASLPGRRSSAPAAPVPKISNA